MEDGAIDGLEFGVDEGERLGRGLGTALGDGVGSVLGLDVVGFLVGVVLGSVELIADGAGTGGTHTSWGSMANVIFISMKLLVLFLLVII